MKIEFLHFEGCPGVEKTRARLQQAIDLLAPGTNVDEISASMDDVDRESVHAVITLCAEEVCPFFPGKVSRLHWALADPADHRAEMTEEFKKREPSSVQLCTLYSLLSLPRLFGFQFFDDFRIQPEELPDAVSAAHE